MVYKICLITVCFTIHTHSRDLPLFPVILKIESSSFHRTCQKFIFPSESDSLGVFVFFLFNSFLISFHKEELLYSYKKKNQLVLSFLFRFFSKKICHFNFELSPPPFIFALRRQDARLISYSRCNFFKFSFRLLYVLYKFLLFFFFIFVILKFILEKSRGGELKIVKDKNHHFVCVFLCTNFVFKVNKWICSINNKTKVH